MIFHFSDAASVTCNEAFKFPCAFQDVPQQVFISCCRHSMEIIK